MNLMDRLRKFGFEQAAALGAALSISVLVFAFRDSLSRFATLGYAGVFLTSLIGNATLILPVPSLVFVFAAGGTLPNPFLVGLVAGIGSTIGELTGYLAGYGSNTFIEHNRTYNRIRDWVERSGLWAIALLAFIPNPLFDLAGFAAGTLGIPLRLFLFATFMGKLFKNVLIAYAGSLSINWIEGLL
jgi:uncharacterized membrane protein YdjX (TVP38/TMEM64 family)